MTDDDRTTDTDAGEAVQDDAPGPESRPDGTLGRDEDEGTGNDPGTLEDAQGG